MILQKAKELANKDKAAIAKVKEEQKREEDYRALQLKNAKNEMKALLKEMHGNDGFEIRWTVTEPKFRGDDYLAELHYNNRFMGVFYVMWRTYTFGDQFDNTTEHHLEFGFRERGWDYRKYDKEITASDRLDKFADKFAEYLKRYY